MSNKCAQEQRQKLLYPGLQTPYKYQVLSVTQTHSEHGVTVLVRASIAPRAGTLEPKTVPDSLLYSGSSAEINTCFALYEAPVFPLLLILGVKGKDFHRRKDGEHTIECEWHARSQHQCGKLHKSGCPSYNWMSVHSTLLKRSLWEVTG